MTAARSARMCGHLDGARNKLCGATDGVRQYLPGYRCPAHTPAKLAGRAEPPSTPLPGAGS